MASFNMSSFFGVRQCLMVAAVVCCIILCVPMTTTALPLKDVVGQAMEMARLQQQQQQHRQKRAVTRTQCAEPSNLQDMFEQINSGMSGIQFLNKAINGKVISIPQGEQYHETNEDPNENTACPATLTTDPQAPLAHRSLCPYYNKVRTLPQGYYPPTLHTAKCKCTKCVQYNAYGCEPVQRDIVVLKPVGCFQGMQRYEEEVMTINTGCTCASAGNVVETTTTIPGYGET